MGYIYKITNKSNQKVYIGQTIKERPTDRYSQHRYLANHPEQERGIGYLHRAMAKEGLDNFSFEIVEEVNNDLLNDREQYWIVYYNSLVPNGYNITEGGAGTIGHSRPQTLEEREKRKQSNKQYYIDHPEAKQMISERTKELWKDEDYRNRVTESNKKFYAEHPDMFKGENNPFYGKHHTEETKAKIKASSISRYKKIAKLDKDTLEVLKIYDGVKEAERDLQVSHGWISKAANQDKVAYGFRWKFL